MTEQKAAGIAEKPGEAPVETLVSGMLGIYGAKFHDENSRRVAIEAWSQQFRACVRSEGGGEKRAHCEQCRVPITGSCEGVAPSGEKGWQPIATAPVNVVVDMWIVPKEPEECPRTSSGVPIVATGAAPRLHRGTLGSQPALFKPSHWMPLPEPPKEVTR